MVRGFGHLFAVKGCSIIPSAKCDPAGIVNACFRNCWYVADLGHWIANPVLVLEGLDLSLDEVPEMLAGHLVGCCCPGVGYVLKLQWGFLDVAFDSI